MLCPKDMINFLNYLTDVVFGIYKLLPDLPIKCFVFPFQYKSRSVHLGLFLSGFVVSSKFSATDEARLGDSL